MVFYVSSPHRLEHRHYHRPCLYSRASQLDKWQAARLAHFHAPWYRRLLASSAPGGQVAACLAPTHSTSTLGSPYRFWAACAADRYAGTCLRRLVGRRRGFVLRRIQPVELAYYHGFRRHCSHRNPHVCTRQTVAQTRHYRKATHAAF